MNDERDEGFRESRLLILSELRRISGDVGLLNAKFDEMKSGELSNLKVEMATIKTKTALIAGILGTIGGALVAALIALLFKGHP